MTDQPGTTPAAEQPEIIDEWAELTRLRIDEVHIGYPATGKTNAMSILRAAFAASRKTDLHLDDDPSDTTATGGDS